MRIHLHMIRTVSMFPRWDCR